MAEEHNIAVEQPDGLSQTKKNLEVVLGDSGTTRYGGYFQVDPNADWQQSSRADIIEEMRRTDGAVSAVLKGIKAPILSTEWRIFSYDDTPKGEEIRQYIEKTVFGMRRDWKEFLREAMAFMDFGHYAFELVLKIVDGKIRLVDLEPRVPYSIERWRLSDGTRGIVQRIETDEAQSKNSLVEIPENKLLILTNDKEGDDVTGQSILRPAYIHWKYKSVLYRISGIAADRYGVGVPVVTLPEQYGTEEKESAEEMAKNVRSHEKSYMVLPKGFEFEIATPQGNSTAAQIEQLIDHHNRMIMVTTLEQFLALGSDGVGSLALSKDQSSFFLQHVEDKAHYFAAQFNKQVIRRLVDLNFGPQEQYPELKFTTLGNKNEKDEAEVMKILADAGLLGEIDIELKKWVRENWKYPQLTDEQVKEEEAREDEDEEVEADEKKNSESKLSEKPLKIRRKLSLQEQRVDFVKLNEDFNELESSLEDEMARITADEIERFANTVKTKLDAGDIAGIAALTMLITGSLKKTLAQVIKDAYQKGKTSAVNELGISDRPSTPLKATQIMALDVDELTAGYVSQLERTAKGLIKDATIADASTAAIATEVRRRMKDDASKMITNISGTVVGQYINRGRNSVFEKNILKITSFVRSEVLDDRTCAMCMSLDERVIKASDPMSHMDIVHSHCRGVWVPVFAIEKEQPAITGIPKSIADSFETVDGRPTVNSFKQLKKAINPANSKVQALVRAQMGA